MSIEIKMNFRERFILLKIYYLLRKEQFLVNRKKLVSNE